MQSRDEERGDESFTEHELSGTINPGQPTRRVETFHNQDSPVDGRERLPSLAKKKYSLVKAPERRQPRLQKKKRKVEIKGPFLNPVFLKTWNFYGRTFAPSTFSEPRREGRVELFPGVLRTLSFVISFFFSSFRFLFFFFIIWRKQKNCPPHIYNYPTYSKIDNLHLTFFNIFQTGILENR